MNGVVSRVKSAKNTTSNSTKSQSHLLCKTNKTTFKKHKNYGLANSIHVAFFKYQYTVPFFNLWKVIMFIISDVRLNCLLNIMMDKMVHILLLKSLEVKKEKHKQSRWKWSVCRIKFNVLNKFAFVFNIPQLHFT